MLIKFREWCSSNIEDERKINYAKTPFGSFTSDDEIPMSQINKLGDLLVRKVALVGEEWVVELEEQECGNAN